MKIPTIKFTERFNEYITHNNLTIRQVEQQTEIPNQTLSAWLSGKRIPNAYSLYVLADYMGCSVDYLLGRVDYEFR